MKTTFAWILLAVVAGHAMADTIKLTSGADTGLFSLSPNDNLGAVGAVPVGGLSSAGNKGRMLVLFHPELSIPGGATIVSAKVRLNVIRKAGASSGAGLRLHRMLKAWNEGTKGTSEDQSLGAAAGPGEPTWNERSFGSEPWGKPGADSAEDRVGDASAAVAVGDAGVHVIESTPALVADVQAWVSRKAPNHGWLLVNDKEGVAQSSCRVACRENAAGGPTLEIEFTVAPVPVPIRSIRVREGAIELRFPSVEGLSQSIEYRGNVGAGEWVLLTNYLAGPGGLERVAMDGLGDGPRFYRAR